MTAGTTHSEINAEMHPGGRISGRATDASTHATLANIEVCASLSGGGFGGCASTNAAGEYTISGLATGSYKVSFHVSEESEGGNYLTQFYNGKSSSAAADSVAVVAGERAEGINAEMHPGGQIGGRVTNASTHATLPNILVCAFGAGGGEFFGGCASTNAGGEYAISGLPSGSYDVSFSGSEEGEGGNYLTQFYNGKSNEAEADPLSVTAPGATSGIDAEMRPGGQISGRVTDASTYAALANILVCAQRVGGSGFGIGPCTSTKAVGGSASATSNSLQIPVPNGGFTMTGPPVFEAKSGNLDFFFQFFNPGALRWSLSFRNADVGFADALGLGPGGGEVAEAARRKRGSRRCKAGFVKHGRRCVHLTVPFAGGSRSVAAGTVEIKVHASSKALKALNAGRTLHVSGPFTFQSALGGAPVTHIESAVVHKPKQKKHRKGKKH